MQTRIYVAAADGLGCCYYRCALPYSRIANHGFDTFLINKLSGLELQPERDILVLQRQHHPRVLEYAREFVNRGGLLIAEFDDYLQGIPLNNPARKAYPPGGTELKNLEEIIRISSLVTVSTPELARQYSKFSKNVQVCYNALDLNCIQDLSKEYHKDGIVRLGWAGSGTHYDDFITIIKPVTEVMRENLNTHFVFVGMDYKNLFPIDIQQRMSYAGHTFPFHNGKALFVSPDGNPVYKYYQLLNAARIDIAIAPILEVPFNKCKSYVKLLEYGMSKIPFVATNYGPYSEFVNHRNSLNDTKNSVGFLAGRNPEWKKNLKALINDKNLCKIIADNNYANIIENHSIDNGITQWLNALETIGVTPSNRQGSYTENLISM